ncbi:MAG: STAS/SEC14 domain-containing protein [Aquirufa sp.]
MELIKGDIADYRLDDSGILYSYSKSVLRTVSLMEANVKLVKQITGGKPIPLLIFLKNSPMPDKATRQYSKEKIPELYSAMAMVSKPGLSAFIMKLLFAFQKPPIPMKSFSDELEAKAWLMSLSSTIL